MLPSFDIYILLSSTPTLHTDLKSEDSGIEIHLYKDLMVGVF